MKTITKYTLILATFILASACSIDEWLTVQPEDTLSKDEMFNSKEGFYDALYGIYTLSRDNYDHNGGLMSYEIEHMAAQWEVKNESVESQIKHHEYADLDQQFAALFGNQYKTIANINLMLEYLESQNFLPEQDYKTLKGECLGLRAWLHFDLIRLWGPMPLNVNETKAYIPYVTKLSYNRSDAIIYSQYMDQLKNDINTAETLLENQPFERNYRLQYWGVMALQARINLWLNNKEQALTYANKVIAFADSGETNLLRLAKLEDIGIKDYVFSKEHLFGINANFETIPFRNSLYNTTAYLNELYDYSAADIRNEQWEDRDVSGLDEPAKNLLKFTEKEGSVPIIRLTELYFIAMECGDLELANTLYEKFCTSRSIPYQELTSASQIKEVLFKEYRKDFIGEGIMFHYYKRFETTHIPRNSETCSQKCYILPLPRKEIDVNG